MQDQDFTATCAATGNIAVLGTGLGALVDAVSFAGQPFHVRLQAPDADAARVLRQGASTFDEPELAQQLAASQASGRLNVVASRLHACHAAEAVLLWPEETEAHSCEALVPLLQEVGANLIHQECFQLVVIRSLLTPGSMERLVQPILERISGKTCGEDFGLCYSPEVVRPGVMIGDFRNPVRMLAGVQDDCSADAIASLYRGRRGRLCIDSFRTVETARMADLLWQSAKLRFAEELSSLCREAGAPRRAVIDLFKRDSKQNISACYLVPHCPSPEVLDERMNALLSDWERARSMPSPRCGINLVSG